MTSTYMAVILLSCMSFFTAAAGVALAYKFQNSTKGIVVGIGFSTGIMLLVSFVDLLPEAMAQAETRLVLALAGTGALVLFLLHRLIPHIHITEESKGIGSRTLRSAHLVVLGIILHDLPEGFAMANSYVASPALGVMVAVSVALHNLPEEFALALSAALPGRRRFLYRSAFLSALAEPVGAIIGLIAVGILPALNPLFVAFAAGAMIFVSLHELVPMAKTYRSPALFTAGIFLSVAIYVALRIVLG